MHVLEVPEQASEAIRDSLMRTGLFDYVEPDYYAAPASTPNDPSFQSQWYLAKIGGATAWNVTTGSPSVVVAIVDSGISAAHPDLAGKLVPGWNFVASNADTSDLLGHGTEVAGAIGAATNNGIGIAGVSWASLLMPLVVVDRNNFAAYSDIAAAIRYAADRNVRVINISAGGSASSSALESAVTYAWNRGALVFAAAMNNAGSTPYYPAACAHAVAVAATDESDRLAAFSNFGGWVTLAAPGTDILTTMGGGGYGYANGTSFSAPIAAGVAALVMAADPRLTNQEVLAVLRETADPAADGAPNRVNAAKAVQSVSPAGLQPVPSPVRGPVVPDRDGLPHRIKAGSPMGQSPSPKASLPGGMLRNPLARGTFSVDETFHIRYVR